MDGAGEPEGSASSTDEASYADGPEIDAASSHSGLSETFTDWLRLALTQEITDSADLESAMCAVEVMLGAVQGDPRETLADVAKMLREDFGTPETAVDLVQNWFSLQC
ncbi:GIP [Symbiodinium natans]|uniref:GIP protein n=1 Tax=Symbiodinium natans TaxID=878477 RepID=A0A812T7G8_9DINO|nr:GIP [Symbiodinium natans]